MFGRTYMENSKWQGRVYLAPKPFTRRPDECELWLNFGAVVKGEQKFPDYLPYFAPSCTAEQYAALVRELKTLLDEKGHEDDFRLVCCCRFNFNVLHEGKESLQALLKELNTLVAQNTKAWARPARLEAKRGPEHWSGGADWRPEYTTSDHLGKKLESDSGSCGKPQACWPPPGLNLVLVVGGGDEFRRSWGAAGAIPRQEGMLAYTSKIGQPSNAFLPHFSGCKLAEDPGAHETCKFSDVWAPSCNWIPAAQVMRSQTVHELVWQCIHS